MCGCESKSYNINNRIHGQDNGAVDKHNSSSTTQYNMVGSDDI